MWPGGNFPLHFHLSILEERNFEGGNFQGNEFFIYWGILEKRNFGGEEFWKGGILRRGTLERKRNFGGEEFLRRGIFHLLKSGIFTEVKK